MIWILVTCYSWSALRIEDNCLIFLFTDCITITLIDICLAHGIIDSTTCVISVLSILIFVISQDCIHHISWLFSLGYPRQYEISWTKFLFVLGFRSRHVPQPFSPRLDDRNSVYLRLGISKNSQLAQTLRRFVGYLIVVIHIRKWCLITCVAMVTLWWLFVMQNTVCLPLRLKPYRFIQKYQTQLYICRSTTSMCRVFFDVCVLIRKSWLTLMDNYVT